MARCCLTRTIPGAATATLGFFIGSGSRIETESNNGISHFLEHMTFKGTNALKPADIDRITEDLGVRLDAYTQREMTAYFARCPREHFDRVFSLMSEFLQDSEYRHSDINRERQTILAECEEVAKVPFERIFDEALSRCYAGSGPAANINRFTQADLLAHARQYYRGSNMVVAAVGDVDQAHLLDLAAKHIRRPQKR
ncbi:putative mitochondrial-processing peptidase subunit beta [Paratrimastix pyriformis]|uniref:Mitochondrial-processing peptidase subunit beta n=1 Tax=Paratrimastix pyriformis TaxID=342808 RepID=A0ABQ8UW87_9EUKA|nr:putative mitochondrial-processing peptidase subunit beta [Paratrimastix pyriformis]